MQNNGLLWVLGQYYNYTWGLVSRSANYLYARGAMLSPLRPSIELSWVFVLAAIIRFSVFGFWALRFRAMF